MSKKCKNCGEVLLGDYCYRCGQKSSTGRLTMRYFFRELEYSFTHADRRGVFFTLKSLFTRPGRMLKDYILGRRINYFKPFPLLIILAGLCGISNHFVDKRESGKEGEEVVKAAAALDSISTKKGTTANYTVSTTADKIKPGAGGVSTEKTVGRAMKAAIDGMSGTLGEKDISTGQVVWKAVKGWVEAHQLIFFILFLLPLFAFSMKKAFRRVGVTRYNYAECLYVSAYLFCQWLIIKIIFLPLDFFQVTNGGFWTLTLFFALSVWTFGQFFGIGARRSFWRTIWLGIILCVFSFVTLAVFSLIWVLFTYSFKGVL